MDGLRSDLKCVSSDAQMEANASSLMREKLNTELSELKRWRADAERRMRMLLEQKADLEKKLRNASAAGDRERASLAGAIESLEHRAGLAGSELEAARRDAAELRASVTAANLAKDAVLREVEVLRGWKADAERSHGTQMVGLKADYEEASEELERVRCEASSLEADVAALRLENETLLQEVRLLGDARGNAEGRLRESSDELARLSAELDAKSADVEALTSMFKSIGPADELDAAVEAMRRERVEVESRLRSQEEALRQAKAEMDDAMRKHEVELGIKNEEINLIYGDLAEAKTACSSLEEIIKKMTDEINTKDSAFEAEEEIIRDLRCQIDSLEMISTLQQELDTNHAEVGGQCKEATPMVDKNANKNAQDSTQSGKRLADELQGRRSLESNVNLLQEMSLDDMRHLTATLYAKLDEVNSLNLELEEARSSLKESRSQYDASVQMAESKAEELSRLQTDLGAAGTKIEELDREIVRLTAECNEKQECILKMEADISFLRGGCEDHLATIRERDGQIEILESKLNRHEMEATTRDLTANSQERDALKHSTLQGDKSQLKSDDVEGIDDAIEAQVRKEGQEHLGITSRDKMASEVLARKVIDLEREVGRQTSKYEKAVKALAEMEEALLVSINPSASRCSLIRTSQLMMLDG